VAEHEVCGQRAFVPKGVALEYFKRLYPKKTMRRKFMGRAYKMVLAVGLGKRLGLA
jgi:hypothetical protein